MKIPKQFYAIAALAMLLVLSGFTAFSNLQGATVTAQNESTNASGTGIAEDLLRYEWPQVHGDPASTRFSAGPAPNAPDVLWKTNITGIQSYLSAFNGMVFVTTNTSQLFALNGETGSAIWNTTVPAPGPWPRVYKIDESHMVIGNSCLYPETGQTLWTSPDFSATAQPLFTDNVYSPEERMFYIKANSYIQAWDFADPSQPPTLAWETYVPGGGSVGSGTQYGDGKVFPGSFDSHQMALDARTGDVLWDKETTGPMLFSGTYSDGKFFRGGTHDNTFYAFDAETGDVLWTFNPGTQDGYFCSGTAVAYGMVYALNKDGYLYALDVNTGDVIWKYEGPGGLIFPGTPTVADGKIYATTGQAASYTGVQGESEFVSLDVYTGRLLWKLPIEALAPRESVIVAYGNLYMIPGDVTTAVDSISGNEYSTVNQVWAMGTRDWPMWRRDPAHSAVGQSGPTNLTLRWKFTAGGAVVSSPSVSDGRVYFGSQDKNIYCVDDIEGSLIWKFATGARIESSPAVVNGKVYTGADDGNVYCLDAYNGSLIWSTYAGGFVPADFNAAVILRSSPIVVGDRVYVGALDNETYALDAATGDAVWSFQTQGYITSSPAVADGAVYVISQEPASGALYKLNATTGDLIWKQTFPYQQLFMGGTDLHASPTVAEGMVFASSNAGEYYGINAETGVIEWTYSDPSAQEFIVCSTIYKDGKLFLIDKFSIVCVDAKTGDPVWDTFIGDELYVSPSYADGKLYVVTDQRSIYVLNATDGAKLGNYRTSSNSWSAPSLYEGKLYVGNNDWNVYCFSDYPALNSSVTIELAKPKVALGESVTGFGNLFPGMANASITVPLVRPDGAVINVQVTTSEKGAFNFAYTPDVVGNWAVAAQWQSDKSYYLSATSEHAPLEVTSAPTSFPPSGVPIEYVLAAAVIIAIIVADVLVYVYMKRPKKQK